MLLPYWPLTARSALKSPTTQNTLCTVIRFHACRAENGPASHTFMQKVGGTRWSKGTIPLNILGVLTETLLDCIEFLNKLFQNALRATPQSELAMPMPSLKIVFLAKSFSHT